MNRHWLTLLYCLIIVFIFSACAASNPSGAGQGFPASDLSAPEASALETDAGLSLTLAVPLPLYYADVSDVLDSRFTLQASGFSVDGTPCVITYIPFADSLGLQTLLLSDSPPDIILFSANQYDADMPCEETLSRRGYLMDLEPFLNTDASLADRPLIPSFCEAMRASNDGLYTLSYQFYLRTLSGPSELLGNEAGWSMDTFLDQAENLASGTELMLPYEPATVLNALIRADLYDFVDKESETCSFDSPLFERLLAFCKTNDGNGNSPSILDGTIMPLDANETITDGSTVYIGYPGVSGNGALLDTGDTMGICTLSRKQNLAWEFIKSYLSQDYQRNNTAPFWPVIQSDFEYRIQKGNTSDDEKELMMNLVRNADTRTLMYHPVAEIVNEEAAAFFDDSKPAGQVAAVIQNRAEIYLGENAGS